MLRIVLLIQLFSIGYAWLLLSEAKKERFTGRTLASACAMTPGMSNRQREICIRNPLAMKHVVEGLRMAMDECQETFRNHVWNCTVIAPGQGMSPSEMASKESAYVYAISSAGVSHALAKACAKGEIEDCGCGPMPTLTGRNFVWAGCSDNVRYGNSFGRKFIDTVDKVQKDSRALMNLHNNRVGRRLLALGMQKQCKCHGVSGSCVTKTCWKVVPRFDQFATMLREKYELAQQVTADPDSSTLMVRAPVSEKGRSERYLKEVEKTQVVKNDLIFLDPSPDYCKLEYNGAATTRGRECGDHCDQICCGRGFNIVREIVDEPCECKFIWCCEVKCKTCKKIVNRHYCR
ncbi:unnamed protein product [Auanema sp. JU1783]|nr:unnamed protein product [Auanema sp. JU1783]